MHEPDTSTILSPNESVPQAGDDNAATVVNPEDISIGDADTVGEAATLPNILSPSASSSDATRPEPQSNFPTTPLVVSARETNLTAQPDRLPLVELIRASSADRRILVRLFQVDDGSCKSTGTEYRGLRGVELPALPPALYKSLLLPTQLKKCESARELFASLCAFFQQHVMLSEQQYRLLSYWSIASWFSDCLPFIPCLAITGPASVADFLLRVLRCVCRRPVLLAGMSPAILRALPVGELMPTLLIREPQLSKRMALLLEASTQAGYLIASGKEVRQFYCAKCIYLGENVQQSTLRPHIHIRVTANGLTPARSLPADDLTQDLQNQLLYFRFVVRDDIASSKFSVPGFLPEFCAVAQALGAPFVHHPDLQVGIIELLKEQDQQARVDRGSGLNAMVLRALLFHCHQGEHQQLLVREIASTVNRIYVEEGESLKISNETVGHVLKNLGLYTRRLGNMGRGLVLDKSTQLRTHELGLANQILPETAGAPPCGHCHKLQISQTEEVG